MIVSNAFNESLTEKSKQHWLSYWKHFDKKHYHFCAEVNCTNEHHHGALVKQNSVAEEFLFVIPLCKEHSNSFRDQIELDQNIEIIPAELSL